MRLYTILRRIPLVLGAALLLSAVGGLLWWYHPVHPDPMDPKEVRSFSYHLSNSPENAYHDPSRTRAQALAEQFNAATFTRYLPSTYEHKLNTFTLCFWTADGELLQSFEVYCTLSGRQFGAGAPPHFTESSWILIRDGSLWEFHPPELIETALH